MKERDFRVNEENYCAVAKLAALLQEDPDLVDCYDPSIGSLLIFAIQKGFADVVKWLLCKGADVNARIHHGWPPIHHASAQGRSDIVELLLANGVKAEAKDQCGRTPSHRVAIQAIHLGDENETARNQGHLEVVQTLLAHGASVDARDEDGATPLHMAACSGNEIVAECFLSKGAEIDAKEKMGLTPLWLAAYNGHSAVAELLMLKGAKINEPSDNGMTPLEATYVGRDGPSRLDSRFARYSWMGFYGSVFGHFERIAFFLVHRDAAATK